MFIDIHCHLNDEKLYSKVDEVIANAKANNVNKLVCASYDYPSSMLALDLARKYDNVYAVIGLHPHACFEYDDKMEQLMLDERDNKKVLAIGEIGLDYYDLDWQIDEIQSSFPFIFEGLSKDKIKEKVVEKQKEVFLKQIKLANKINLPIMIHMRDATGDTLAILEENKKLLNNGGLLHCFNGSLETTYQLFNLGFFISIGGAITFKNAKNMIEVLKEIGLGRVCLETDCPYLSPEPFRGQENQPKNIPLIAQKLSEITNTPIEKVEEITTMNTQTVFNFNKE